MTTIQLKAEMHHIIDDMPEAKVSEVFNYLKSVQQPGEKKDIKKIIDKIIKEEAALLKRLAE